VNAPFSNYLLPIVENLSMDMKCLFPDYPLGDLVSRSEITRLQYLMQSDAFRKCKNTKKRYGYSDAKRKRRRQGGSPLFPNPSLPPSQGHLASPSPSQNQALSLRDLFLQGAVPVCNGFACFCPLPSLSSAEPRLPGSRRSKGYRRCAGDRKMLQWMNLQTRTQNRTPQCTSHGCPPASQAT
jgi:hypothetical protein